MASTGSTGTAGALLVRGDGETLWFASDGAGGYQKAEGDLDIATLVKNGDNTFTLTTKYRDQQNFDSTGLLTSAVDRNNNTTTFAYTSGMLASITDPFSRRIGFGYTGGLLSGNTT